MKFNYISDTVPLIGIIFAICFAFFLLQPIHQNCQPANILSLEKRADAASLETFSIVYAVTNDEHVVEGYMSALDYFKSKPGDAVIACERIGNWIPYSFNTQMERIER